MSEVPFPVEVHAFEVPFDDNVFVLCFWKGVDDLGKAPGEVRFGEPSCSVESVLAEFGEGSLIFIKYT